MVQYNVSYTLLLIAYQIIQPTDSELLLHTHKINIVESKTK